MDPFVAEKMGQQPQRSAVEEQLYARVTELDAKVTKLTEDMGACNAKGVELTRDLEYVNTFWALSVTEAGKLQEAAASELHKCEREKRQENRAKITAEIAYEDSQSKLQKAITQGEDCQIALQKATTQVSGGGRKKRKSRRRKKTRKSKKRKSNKRKTKRKKRSKRH
jgi:hypothetical protein